MPVHTYTNWNSRPSDREEQVEPYRKYYFICEGANTETFYFEKLIDLRKDLGIHPLIDIRLWEKTEGDRNISFAKNLVRFAYEQKSLESNGFDVERDKMIIATTESYLEYAKNLGLSEVYIDFLRSQANYFTWAIVIVGSIVAAVVGIYLSRLIFKKHLIKAGIL